MLYKAFISYSHEHDVGLAAALQLALQRFAKPWNQLRAMRVFLDKSSLAANPDLWSTIQVALDQSEFLVLLASPASAQSHWVQKEVEHWLGRDRARQLLIVLTDGEIVWSLTDQRLDPQTTTAVPPILCGAIPSEPLYTDLRAMRTAEQLSLQDPRFTEAVAGLAATLRGTPKDDLYGEHVSQYRKVVRLRRAVVGALAFLTLSAGAAAIAAVRQRNEARHQAQIALGRQMAAQSEATRAQRAELLPQSLLLGIESMRAFPSMEAGQAIRRALALLPAQVEVMQHREALSAMAVQPGGGRIATAASDGVIRLWDPTGRTELRLMENGSPPLAFSPDGKLLAVVDGTRAVRVWDVEAGREKYSPLSVTGRTIRITFNVDGRLLAASNYAGGGSNISVWDAVTGQVVRILGPLRGAEGNQGLAFSRDGRLAAVEYSRIRMWEVRTWRELPSPELRPSAFADLRFSPDGSSLVAGSPTGTLWVWAGSERQPKVVLNLPALSQIAFSPQGKFLAAAGGEPGETRVWQTDTWSEVAAVKHDGAVTALAFSPSESLLVTTSSDRTAVVWAVPGGVKLTSMDHGDRVLSAAFSPDEQQVITASEDGSARIWQAQAGEVVAVLPGGTDHFQLPILGSGPGTFAALEGASLSIWRMREPHVAQLHLPQAARSRVLSPNGALAASAGPGDTVQVWDVATQQKTTALVHPGEVDWDEYERHAQKQELGYRHTRSTAVQKSQASRGGTVDLPGFSADGRYLLTTRHDFQARVWEVDHRQVVASEPYEFELTASAFSPDGRFVALVKDHNELAVLSLADGRRVLLAQAEQRMDSVAFSESGAVVATVEETSNRDLHGRVRVWRATDWSLLTSIDFTQNDPGAALSPDGRFLALGVGSDTVRLFRTASGKEVARIPTSGVVARVAFSPDNRLVAVAGQDLLVHLWDLEHSRERARLAHNEASLTAEFSPDAQYLATGGLTQTRVFSLSDGGEVARLVHTEPVGRIRFSWGDGKYLAATGRTSTRIWLWRPEDVAREACSRLRRRLLPSQWPQVVGESFESRIERACSDR